MCVVIESTERKIESVFEKGCYPTGSSMKVEDPLVEARAYALGLAKVDPNGTYQIYVLDSEVIKKYEIHKFTQEQ